MGTEFHHSRRCRYKNEWIENKPFKESLQLGLKTQLGLIEPKYYHKRQALRLRAAWTKAAVKFNLLVYKIKLSWPVATTNKTIHPN